MAYEQDKGPRQEGLQQSRSFEVGVG